MLTDSNGTFDQEVLPGAPSLPGMGDRLGHRSPSPTPRWGGAPRFDQEVLRRLAALGRRLRGYSLTTGAASVALYLLVAGAMQLGVDYALRLPKDMRAALLGVILIGLAIILWRRVWQPLRFPYGPREMACLIERRHPELHSVLISAVQFAGGGGWPTSFGGGESMVSPGPKDLGHPGSSPELIRSVVERARHQTADLRFAEVLNHGRARRSGVTVLAVMAVVVIAFAWRPQVMGMWLDRNVLLGDSQWPKRTRLVVDLPGDVLHGARGDDLEVRARAEGVVPRSVDIIFESDSDKRGREPMIAVGERGFRYTFAGVQDAFRFRVKGGDDETAWFDARLTDRPKVVELSISVTPPTYSGIEAFTLAGGRRSVDTLLGSSVTVAARTNKPVVTAELFAGQDPVVPATGGPTQWTAAFEPAETQTYHFDLRDELGLENKRPIRLSIRILKDEPPKAQMKISGAGDLVTAQAVLPIELSFSDTYGLAIAEMVYQLGREGAEVETMPLSEFRPRVTKFDSKLRWAMASLSLAPGDRLVVYARAMDFDDVSGPNEGRSSTASFRVVTADELLAELARREQEYRQDFERMIEQQEELRGQLLTLIRRSGDLDQNAERGEDVGSAVRTGDSGDGHYQVRTADPTSAALERRQRQIASQVNLIRQQFEQILAEMEVNGLADESVRTRLGEAVVGSLTRLAKRELVSASDALRAYGRSPSVETAGGADALQVAVLEEMRRTLSHMLKWEGFQEVVTMLREILRLQGELNAETQEEIERRAAAILGDEGE